MSVVLTWMTFSSLCVFKGPLSHDLVSRPVRPFRYVIAFLFGGTPLPGGKGETIELRPYDDYGYRQEQ